MRFSYTAFSLLASAALLCSCDAPQTEIDGPLAAQYSSAARSVHLVKSAWSDGEGSTDAVISKAGGELRLGGHVLSVPRNAVQHPTRFRMTTKIGDNVIVELTASDIVTGQMVTTFPVNLQLKLSYAGVGVARDEVHDLVVVWLKDESAAGALVPVRTTQIPADTYVVGWVNHFSNYAMGMN